MYQNIPNIEKEKCKQTAMFLFMCLGTILAFRKYFVPINKPGTKYFLNAKIVSKHINKNIAVYIFLFQYLECFGTHFVTIHSEFLLNIHILSVVGHFLVGFYSITTKHTTKHMLRRGELEGSSRRTCNFKLTNR